MHLISVPLLMLLAAELLPAATVTALPGRLTVAPGETVTVTLRATDVPASTAWGQLLRFDPLVLRCTGQAAGNLGTFVADSRTLAVINATGELRSGGYSLTPTAAGADADLAALTFEVVGADTVTLLDVVAFSRPDEPFGCLFLAPGAELVPAVVDATLTVTSGGARIIRLRVAGGGVPLDLVIRIDPAHGEPESVDGYRVFDGLVAEVAYWFACLVPVNG